MKKLFRKTVVSALTAGCVVLQTGLIPTMAAGSYISGTWQETDKGWIHVDAEGARSPGWIHKESGWYYLDPITEIMKTGWLKDVDGQ